jgi:hypothetical protein
VIVRGTSVPRFGLAHGIYLLAAGAIALAAVGAVLAFGVLNSPPSRGAAGVGQSVETSFGSVAIAQQNRGTGLKASDLAGMTHGIQNFVGDDQALQQVQVVISNTSDGTVPYSPEQFSVLLGKSARRVGVLSSNVKAGVLQPRASIELNLGFVVPRNGQRIVLAFKDAGARKDALFNLGYTDRAPPGAGSHNH